MRLHKSKTHFSNQQAALDFVDKMLASDATAFGTVDSEEIKRAIVELEMTSPAEGESEHDAICHGLRYMICIEIEMHTLGGIITNDGWMSDTLDRVCVERIALCDYVAKRNAREETK